MSERATQILSQLAGGRASAADRLLPLVYDELRGLAAGYLRRERVEHTLQPTALVHEAYLKLIDEAEPPWKTRAHFLGVAARAMRQVLIDHARRHNSAKRGGEHNRLTLHDTLGVTSRDVLDLIALDDALETLSGLDERQGRIVELRFFGGLTTRETAHLLGVSVSTVESDWRMARAWLHRALNTGAPQ